MDVFLFTDEESKQCGETPDFKVYKDSKLLFYCEVKSIDKEIFVEEEQFGTDNTYNQIAMKRIHKSVKQFDSVNPNRDYPNVLVIVNHQFGVDVADLHLVFSGIPLESSDKVITFVRKDFAEKIRTEKNRIDLYI